MNAGLVCLAGALVAVAPHVMRRPPRRATALRRPRGSQLPEVDAVLLLDVVDAALRAGAPIPRTLQVVGGLLGGTSGAAMTRAAGALVLGASWPAAWAGSPIALRDLADCLEPAWTTGVAPGPALRVRAARVRTERRTHVRASAATLAVRLVLPLGLCFLPAFILLGLVPLILSLAAGLLG
ncbi:type II secretion system F family protein [Cellulomonas edaphi]|uniref:Type II secretion system F family protein n=1 Tax=Cellulomonas edaphi TaxID=3053468 RepID=A0ABT7S9I9_9CELL|nr:type II secretion system F family protein [Cellulomons edaphi]MDM7832287.1 type II secretion system F family protein [Cellulomons edaphi]